MKNYLSNKLQRVLVESSFSSWDEIISKCHKEFSILEPLLFNKFLNDLLFLFATNSNVSIYTDDNIIYVFGQKLEEIKHILHCDFEKLQNCLMETI